MKQEQSRDERLQRLWMINKGKYKGKNQFIRYEGRTRTRKDRRLISEKK